MDVFFGGLVGEMIMRLDLGGLIWRFIIDKLNFGFILVCYRMGGLMILWVWKKLDFGCIVFVFCFLFLRLLF